MRIRLTGMAVAAGVWLAAQSVAPAQAPLKGGGSRTLAVHRIPIYDATDQKILPAGEEPIMPLSTRTTCGKCHDYEKISSGWHFNAMDETVPPGRAGELWVLVDERTGTQLPLSYRPRPNAWKPADVGVTPWQFTELFARHFPGGGPAGKYGQKVIDPYARWEVSGELEINCFACHNGDPHQDQVMWFQQIGKQNFRWANTAASGLAEVSGNARKLPDMFDIIMDDNPEEPKVVYDKARFNAKGEVFFDLVRRPDANRCYACHSRTNPQTEGHEGKWKADEDIHLTGGMTCADCHRNGLDHMISRGGEGDAALRGHPSMATLTCQGCHLGTDQSQGGPTMGGRLGAPVPAHVGLPTIHLEKLTCTACHAGPWPGRQALREQNSRTHDLETHIKHHGPDVLPFIRSPVFVRQEDGKIGLHQALWPAFWGRLKDGKVTPLAPKAVADAAGKVLAERPGRSAAWTPLKTETIIAVLQALAGDAAAGQPVYVASGKLHALTGEGRLEGREHESAAPCTWPYAHDVRPAAQALGAGPDQAGCRDCHTTDSAFFFGTVAADGPAEVEIPSHEMTEFQKLDSTQMKLFNFTFVFRPYLKLTVFAASALAAAVLLWFGLRALAAVTKWFAGWAPAPTEGKD